MPVLGPSMHCALGCLLLAGACADHPFELARETVPGTATGPKISHDPPRGTAERMAHHFTDTLEIQRAVIAGELADVRPPARRLAERTDPYPESWRPFMAGNVVLAYSALVATSVPEAAAAAAGLANNCGECHAAVGLGPSHVTGTPPPDARDTPEHMLRHQWAAERMWEALVAHDDAAWHAGAEALSDAALLPQSLPTDVSRPGALHELAAQVHDLGAQARSSAPWAARAALHGELLATCAACHRGLLLGRLPYLARGERQAARGSR